MAGLTFESIQLRFMKWIWFKSVLFNWFGCKKMFVDIKKS